MMETCHEYGLLAALTLVPFHVFVGARSFHVFQKRCSQKAVGFFVVPVSYLFRPSWVGVVGENAHHCKRTQVCFPPSKFHSKGSTKECVQRNPSNEVMRPSVFSSYSLVKSQDQTIQMSFCPNSAPSEVVVWDERALAKMWLHG